MTDQQIFQLIQAGIGMFSGLALVAVLSTVWILVRVLRSRGDREGESHARD